MPYPFESLQPENRYPSNLFVPESSVMKRIFATLFSALLLLPGAAAHAAPSCRIPGGRVVVSGAVARLLAVPTLTGNALFACIRRSGRKIALDDGYTNARLAGRWVAWERPGRPGHWRIAVHDLRTGKERLVDGHVAAKSLGVTARGSIVWAQELDSGPQTPLFANEVANGGRLLDDGAVDATSVRLEGRRVTWFSSDVLRSATVR
jgi:hypothetical protein